MRHAIDRPGRPAALRGAVGAVLMMFFGFASAAATEAGMPLRLAQAQPHQTGPRTGTAQRQAQPPANTVEGQLADLKNQLNITAAQQPQFDEFAKVVRQSAQEMDALIRQHAQQAPRPNAVEDLRAAIQFADAQAAGLKRLLPALEALYATLSDQQKRTADQVLTNAPPAREPQQRRRQG